MLDVRATWNAVEKLAALGLDAEARGLAEVLREPRVAATLAAIAEEEGHAGGAWAAEQAAVEALDDATEAPLTTPPPCLVTGHAFFGTAARGAVVKIMGEGPSLPRVLMSVVELLRAARRRRNDQRAAPA
jgi:hypothetical protein